MQNKNNEAEIFAKFIKDRTVVIADPSSSSRSGLFRIMHNLGGQTHNIAIVSSFEDAVTAIGQKKPHIVIAEYELGKRCGLELLQSQREQNPQESKKCLFVVVTGNTSQTAVARAAEEDIDAYIIKPYTMESVRRTIMQAAIRKINPSEYQLAIDAGKKLIEEQKLDEAEVEFSRATKLDSAPSLAYSYLGQIKLLRKVLEESKGNYQKGLEFNRIHYKCLVGLYDVLMSQNAHKDAYEVVKKVSQYFPANPKRLIEVLRLAILTGQYDDIEKYYGTFTNIDERNDTLVKYVCAALVVCGKYYISTSVGHSRALELFRKAAITGGGRANILKEIVIALVNAGITKEVPYFLERFPQDGRDTMDYHYARFLLADGENQVAIAINQGRALMNRGCTEERLFTTLIKRGAEAKLSKMAMEEIVSKACATLPLKKELFEELAKKFAPEETPPKA